MFYTYNEVKKKRVIELQIGSHKRKKNGEKIKKKINIYEN